MTNDISNPYSILIALSVLIVLSYFFNFISQKIKIPSVLLLIGCGIGLKYSADAFGLILGPTKTLLEILGITGLIFIVLEASLDLSIQKSKLPLIGKAFVSALVLLSLSAGLIALIFMNYYEASFSQSLLHAIPLSVISSAIAIPSVDGMDESKREFIIYESTFSDILGIIFFNFMVVDQSPGLSSVIGFGTDLIIIILISVASTVALIFLLNHSVSRVRFFLTFAILILTYSMAKFIHLPSLLLVLCFGLVLNNFALFDHPVIRRFLSFEKLSDVAREMKMMTGETAFIIRTFFFILFGYSINLTLLTSQEVIFTGIAIILITAVLRFAFLNYFLKIKSTPLALIAPRGLITVLLFYSIPESKRIIDLSEGVLFVVIFMTSLLMMTGLLLNKENPKESIEDLI